MKQSVILAMLLAAALLIPAVGAAQCSCETPQAVQTGVKEATCLEPGYAVMECKTCAGTWTEALAAHPAKGHQWTHSGTQDATCVSAGYEEYVCSGCGAIKRSTIQPTGHDWSLYAHQDAVCMADGFTEYRCEKCSAQRLETQPSLGGHKWTFTEEKAPTCKLDGYKAYVCDVCSAERKDLLYATNDHKWRLSFLQPAGCETNGYEEYDCSVCMTKKKTPLQAAGHSWEQIKETLGDCLNAGLVVERCAMCAKERTVSTEKGDHDYRQSGHTDPTCDKKGSNTYTCTVCGGEKEESIDAVGHIWGDAKISKRPSCTAEGLAVSTCTVCGEKEERVLGMTSHEYGEWKSLKKASRKSNGVRERVCAVCGGKDAQEYTLEQASQEKAQAESKKDNNTVKVPEATSTPAAVEENADTEDKGTGTIEIICTAAKVNLRSGPGKRNSISAQVPKKNTSLGELIESATDKDGAVWYHIKYKKKDGWISAQYAKAVFGGFDPANPRLPAEGSTDLRDYFFCDMSVSAQQLNLLMKSGGEAESDALIIRGERVVKQAELRGKGYSLHGVTIGQTFKEAKRLLEEQGIFCVSGTADRYVFKRPCAANAIAVTKDGFDSTIELQLDRDGMVGAVVWRTVE